MTNNKGKGGKNRRKGKRVGDNPSQRETVLKEDLEDYGCIDKVYGNGRFLVICADGQTRKMGVLRGNLRKKVWIRAGDFVLYGIREFEEAKIDILHKYSNEDVQRLWRYEEIDKKIYDHYTSDIANVSGQDETDIHFADEDDKEDMQKEIGDDLMDWTRISAI